MAGLYIQLDRGRQPFRIEGQITDVDYVSGTHIILNIDDR